MAKCLVTGGCGFIGSNLVDKLVDEGHEVLVIDDESAICHDQFYYNHNVKYYKYSICDYINTRELYDGVDYVFDLDDTYLKAEVGKDFKKYFEGEPTPSNWFNNSL